ncbi:family 1 glycosylhydrolase, partial [Klebsiella pneumoniae]|nr:family 1 glycosylhydrolase [Klebsiella pneumoniae]
YHWDLPQALEDGIGGWLSRDVVPLFADYAAEVARRFGDRLESIATLNEPWCSATLGYETAQFAPGHTSRAEAAQVSHHLLMAHGAAIQAMRAVGSKAQLGIVLNFTPSFPAEPLLEADRRAARIDDGLSNSSVESVNIPSGPQTLASRPLLVQVIRPQAFISAMQHQAMGRRHTGRRTPSRPPGPDRFLKGI